MKRLLALAAFVLIVGGLFEAELVRFVFRDRQPIRERITELPYLRLPGLRAFLADVLGATKPGDRIAIWFNGARWEHGYYDVYFRAAYLLEGRRVLPLLYGIDRRLLTENLAQANYVACWRCETAPPGYRVARTLRGGVLAEKQ